MESQDRVGHVCVSGVIGEYVSVVGFGFIIRLVDLPSIEKLDLQRFVVFYGR